MTYTQNFPESLRDLLKFKINKSVFFFKKRMKSKRNEIVALLHAGQSVAAIVNQLKVSRMSVHRAKKLVTAGKDPQLKKVLDGHGWPLAVRPRRPLYDLCGQNQLTH